MENFENFFVQNILKKNGTNRVRRETKKCLKGGTVPPKKCTYDRSMRVDFCLASLSTRRRVIGIFYNFEINSTLIKIGATRGINLLIPSFDDSRLLSRITFAPASCDPLVSFSFRLRMKKSIFTWKTFSLPKHKNMHFYCAKQQYNAELTCKMLLKLFFFLRIQTTIKIFMGWKVKQREGNICVYRHRGVMMIFLLLYRVLDWIVQF